MEPSIGLRRDTAPVTPIQQPRHAAMGCRSQAARQARECLDSIINQTFTDFEIILVDDFSTDETLDIAEQILKDFNNSKIISLTQNTPGGGSYSS